MYIIEAMAENFITILTMLTGVISFFVTLSITRIFNLRAQRIIVFGNELYARQAFAICSLIIMLTVNTLWLLFGRSLKIKH